jgi:hypothetical protein
MEETSTAYRCFNCNRSETEIPLVGLRYAGNQTWVCSQCLPVLIHHPQQVADRLTGAEK